LCELKAKPVFQTRAAEGMKAVEEGERLIEDFRANLEVFNALASHLEV
jgi:hypothetical protein